MKGCFVSMRTSFFETKKIFFVCSLFVFVIACVPQDFIYKEPLQEDGEVIIYLQPLPKEAGRLVFAIDGISLVREDGNDIPLSLSLKNIKGPELVGVQKMLASGIIPEGPYTGISVKIKKASLKAREGEAALLLSGRPVIVTHHFEVARRKALTLFLNLDPAEFISEGFIFTPLFTLTTQGMELLNLRGFISSSDSNIINVFNKRTMLNVGAIATGRAPKGIVIDENRGRAYVAVSGDDVIAVIDVFTGQIIEQIRLNFGDEPIYLGLTPDGGTLVSVNYGSNTVSIIDASARFEVRKISVDEGPASAVIDPLGLRAYIINSMSNTISVIDISSRVLSATIAVQGTPWRGAFNSNGDILYVISRDTPDLSVINTSNLTVTGKIFTGTGALSIEVDERTDYILIGNKTGGVISIIDPSSLMFIDTIRTGGAVTFMTIDNEENALFVVVPEKKMLQKIDLTSKSILDEIDVGEGAYAIAIMGGK